MKVCVYMMLSDSMKGLGDKAPRHEGGAAGKSSDVSRRLESRRCSTGTYTTEISVLLFYEHYVSKILSLNGHHQEVF